MNNRTPDQIDAHPSAAGVDAEQHRVAAEMEHARSSLAPEGCSFSDSEVNDLLDAFEVDWRSDATFLVDFVRTAKLAGQAAVIGELVRADIDRRYEARAEVKLDGYFVAFPELQSHAASAIGIAYEDFRARQTRGLAISPSRWISIPGVRQQSWFRELVSIQSELHRSRSSTSIGLGLRPVVEASQEPEVGEFFGDFQLVCLLGTGAFSQVFLAKQRSLADRFVALKIVRRTLEEPVHLARMQHTGIVPLYSFHRFGDYSILCMPYSGATTLADWMESTNQAQDVGRRNGESLVETVLATQQRVTREASSWRSAQPPAEHEPQPATQQVDDRSVAKLDTVPIAATVPDESLSLPLQHVRNLSAKDFPLWFAQRMASALAHAHARRIVHGDLKPANILIRNDGEPALIDFNLSRGQDDESQRVVGGTLPYMAPEQFQSLISRKPLIVPPSDIYSLGVILYQLVEGRLPFSVPRSSAESDLEPAIEERRSMELTWSANRISAGLQSIIEKCLSFDAAQRYTDGTQLLADIEAERLNLPLPYAKETVWGRAAKLQRRYPRLFSTGLVATVALVAMMMLGMGAYTWWYRSNQWMAVAQVEQLGGVIKQQMPRMLEASPEEISRLSDSFDTQVAGLMGNDGGDVASWTRWLPASDRLRAEQMLFDASLAHAFLSLEKLGVDNAEARQSARNQLERCNQLESIAQSSPTLSYLSAQLESPASANDSSELVAMLKRSKESRPLEAIIAARVELQSNAPAAALNILERAERPAEFSSMFWLTIGEAQFKLGQFSTAKISYSLAIDASPEVGLAYARRAEVNQAMTDYASAVSDYTEAMRLSPLNGSYVANRALAHELAGQYALAIADIDHALELAPKSNRLLFIRSRLARLAGDTARSAADFELALQSEPKTVEDWVSRALAQADRWPERALEDLKQALVLHPNSAIVLQNLAYVESELRGQWPQAIEALDKILDRDSSDERALGGRCVLLARVGRIDDCLRDIKHIENTIRNPMPVTLYQIACAHALVSDKHEASKQQAIRYLARAVDNRYGLELLETDPDLELVRKTDEFRQLLRFVDYTIR